MMTSKYIYIYLYCNLYIYIHILLLYYHYFDDVFVFAQPGPVAMPNRGYGDEALLNELAQASRP